LLLLCLVKVDLINIDIKAIDRSVRRPLNNQTQDINQNIKDLFDCADDPTKVQVICDISALPPFLEDVVIKNITQGLDSDQLENISFLLD
jgi:pyruvate-formate lyase-activating enzyme